MALDQSGGGAAVHEGWRPDGGLERVVQRDSDDCMLAVISMLSGDPLGEVHDSHSAPMGVSDLLPALHDRGVPAEPASTFNAAGMAQEGRALVVGVERPDGAASPWETHALVVDGGRLLDPWEDPHWDTPGELFASDTNIEWVLLVDPSR